MFSLLPKFIKHKWWLLFALCSTPAMAKTPHHKLFHIHKNEMAFEFIATTDDWEMSIDITDKIQISQDGGWGVEYTVINKPFTGSIRISKQDEWTVEIPIQKSIKSWLDVSADLQ